MLSSSRHRCACCGSTKQKLTWTSSRWWCRLFWGNSNERFHVWLRTAHPVRITFCQHLKGAPSSMNLDQPAEEKLLHSMKLPPPCFTAGRCLGFKLFIWAEQLPVCISYETFGKLQINIFLWILFQQQLPSCCSSIESRFVEGRTNSCPVDWLSHLSCGSPQLLQSYHQIDVNFRIKPSS